MTGKSLWVGAIIGGFITLVLVLGAGLSHNPNALELATKGQKMPDFSLPDLLGNKAITNQDLTTGQPHTFQKDELK